MIVLRTDFQVKNVVFYITDDHSRVVLTEMEGNPCSDYVNASYIDVSPPFVLK